jgi:hypothetical protein
MRKKMVRASKNKGALRAINEVLVRARAMAFEREPYEVLARLLDDAEELPMLLARDDDTTDEFRAALEGLATNYPVLAVALQRFDADETT